EVGNRHSHGVTGDESSVGCEGHVTFPKVHQRLPYSGISHHVIHVAVLIKISHGKLCCACSAWENRRRTKVPFTIAREVFKIRTGGDHIDVSVLGEVSQINQLQTRIDT